MQINTSLRLRVCNPKQTMQGSKISFTRCVTQHRDFYSFLVRIYMQKGEKRLPFAYLDKCLFKD